MKMTKGLTKKQKWGYDIITEELNKKDYVTINGLIQVAGEFEKGKWQTKLSPQDITVIFKKSSMIICKLNGVFRDPKQNCPMNVIFLPNKFEKVMNIAKKLIKDNELKKLEQLKERITQKEQFIERIETQKRELILMKKQLNKTQTSKKTNGGV